METLTRGLFAARSFHQRRPESLESRDETAVGPLELILFGSWFGMAAGYLEVGLLLAERWGLGKIRYETLHLNWHYAWMIPVFHLVCFTAIGGILGFLALKWPRFPAVRIARFLYGFLLALTLGLGIPGLYKWSILFLSIGIATFLVRRISSHRTFFRRLMRRTLPVMCTITVVLVTWNAISVSSAEEMALAGLPSARPGAPNILLIVLDTVRADALSLYGSSRDTAPNLARLARRGVRFDQARSTSPWTLPSHASLFTGRLPHELSANVGRPLDETYPTLAEFLAGQGYATGAFVANTHNGNAWYGLDRGFARYEDFYENTSVTFVEILRASRLGRTVLTSRLGRSLVQSIVDLPRYNYRKTGAMINRDLLTWLSDRDDRPFFAFLNYYDAHDPYEVPEGAPRRFWDSGARSPRSKADATRDAYDDCLAYLDSQIGRLFAELEKRSLLDETLVIITADHGEGFGEHGLSGHGISLYRPELHVPLLILDAHRINKEQVVEAPVSLREIPATITSLAGFADLSPFPGDSLARFWGKTAGNEALYASPVMSEVDRGGHLPAELSHVPAWKGVMQSVLDRGTLYIRNGDGSEELYDVQSDPDERHDLSTSPESQAELERLRKVLPDSLDSDA